MPTLQITTQLKDSADRPHDYTAATFPATEGADLLLELGEIIGGPVGHALNALFSVSDGPDGPDLDLSSLPAALEALPRVVIAKGGADFVRTRILKYAKRAPVGSNDWQRLGVQADFDQAYAGNYREMGEAIGWIIVENFLPFSGGTTNALTELWSKLKDFLPIEPIQSEPEPQRDERS